MISTVDEKETRPCCGEGVVIIFPILVDADRNLDLEIDVGVCGCGCASSSPSLSWIVPCPSNVFMVINWDETVRKRVLNRAPRNTSNCCSRLQCRYVALHDDTPW